MGPLLEQVIDEPILTGVVDRTVGMNRSEVTARKLPMARK